MIQRKKAFTLVELIMVMLILGILSGIGVHFIFEVGQARIFQWQRKEISESAELALNIIDREIRRVASTASIPTATATSFRFTDISGRDITYDVSGTSLRRNLGGTINVLADNLNSLTFSYYDAAGAAIAVPVADTTTIRRINISLTFANGSERLSVMSDVAPRRLQ